MKKEYIQPAACIKHVTTETPVKGVSNQELGIVQGTISRGF